VNISVNVVQRHPPASTCRVWQAKYESGVEQIRDGARLDVSLCPHGLQKKPGNG